MSIYLMSDNKSYIDYWQECVDLASTLDATQLETLTKDDVLIVDINSLDTLKHKPAKMIVLENIPTFEKCMLLMKEGVNAYGNTYMHASHILSALECLKEEKIWIYPDFLALMMQQTSKSDTQEIEGKLAVLTEREQEIARLVLDGYTNKELANSLKISVNTIKVHTKNIYTKCNVTDRLSLFSYLK